MQSCAPSGTFTYHKERSGYMGRMAQVVATLATVLLLPGLALAEGNAQKGAGLYGQFCVPCHGAAGKGDGAAAAALNPKPRDLTGKAYMANLKDDYLLGIVKKGGASVGKSALMPPWGAAMKDDEIQDVIAFVRGLGK